MLEKLIDDDSDLRDLNLTYKKRMAEEAVQSANQGKKSNKANGGTDSSSTSSSSSSSTDSDEESEAEDEVEMLLESYYMQVRGGMTTVTGGGILWSKLKK